MSEIELTAAATPSCRACYRPHPVSAEIRQRIASAVIELRMRRGWDRAELATRAGLTVSEIDRVETATASDLGIDALGALAEALEVPVERLVEDTRDVIHSLTAGDLLTRRSADARVPP